METDKILGAEEQLAEGLRLIGESSFGDDSRREFRKGWTRWVQWCSDAGVDPLDATWEQTLECLLSDERMRSVQGALRCVYRARGVASPSDDRRLEHALGMVRMPSADLYVASSRLRVSLHRSDYLAWCHRRHKNPASVSVEEVAEYLSSLGTRMTYRQVRSVNVSDIPVSHGAGSSAERVSSAGVGGAQGDSWKGVGHEVRPHRWRWEATGHALAPF